jgi:hypothetical protein
LAWKLLFERSEKSKRRIGQDVFLCHYPQKAKKKQKDKIKLTQGLCPFVIFLNGFRKLPKMGRKGAIMVNFGKRKLKLDRMASDEYLNANITVWMTDSEKEQVKREAKENGYTISNLCRQKILNKQIISKVDFTFTNELRRTAGLVKHIYLKYEKTNSDKTGKALDLLIQLLYKFSSIE